jgi:hypothetical protein
MEHSVNPMLEPSGVTLAVSPAGAAILLSAAAAGRNSTAPASVSRYGGYLPIMVDTLVAHSRSLSARFEG